MVKHFLKYKLIGLLLLIFLITSCNQQNKESKVEEVKNYDEKGKRIVYNEDVYTEMWRKNKNLDVTVIDTFCINQKARAIRDIKNGKLIYFDFHPLELDKMARILSHYGIETQEQLRRDVKITGFEPYCYEFEMHREISRKFGEKFIDSIFRVAQKEYILENPNEEYIEDGIDLREKYLKKK